MYLSVHAIHPGWSGAKNSDMLRAHMTNPNCEFLPHTAIHIEKKNGIVMLKPKVIRIERHMNFQLKYISIHNK